MRVHMLVLVANLIVISLTGVITDRKSIKDNGDDHMKVFTSMIGNMIDASDIR